MIATERLRLLPLQVEYAVPMAEVLSDPSLYTFTGGEPPTVQALEARYRRQLAGPDSADEQWLNWVTEYDDKLIGYVQATLTGRTAEIAWVIGTAWQGRGFAKEAAQGLVTWLRAHGAREIVAHIHPDHTASAAVAAAIGLARTDLVEDGEYLWSTAGPA
ncbi:GNAT family N-acetyltransferase [Kribbella jejuensis]|uniref:RimJ/RimL family protein N-acetyltransferase n=1 Tax=Kribbella jejuensis TaxID=236068 RepID=A0A542EA97_9ACTN|nr:GNAT family N-acetyltransferase [Kribbella jejuensis]TQJ12252.1 RimJ/RimL family protein N-acetyltransferase [Kribbella jejuensis]